MGSMPQSGIRPPIRTSLPGSTRWTFPGRPAARRSFKDGSDYRFVKRSPCSGYWPRGRPKRALTCSRRQAPSVLRNDCQLAVVFQDSGADGDATLKSALQALSERWPDRIQVRDDSPSLPHEILGASDLVLVPCRNEPCGFTQMAAHRYGALPIARRVGSLADTIVDCDAKLETGIGLSLRRRHRGRSSRRGSTRLRGVSPRWLRCSATTRDAHRPQLGPVCATLRTPLPRS